ncbi:MAG: sensor histidine kinase [Pseudomonadota bacterium]
MNKPMDTLFAIAGIVTWLVVFSFTTTLMMDAGGVYAERFWESVVLQVLFLAGLLGCRHVHAITRRDWFARFLFFLTLADALILGWRIPIEFLQIYTIMWISATPFYFKRNTCIALLFAVIASWWVIAEFSWQDTNGVIQVLLFATFHLFALVSALATQRSEEANERSEQLNAELISTQHLLTEASRQGERTRIARNLHDLLGHHLTALTINLQVASRITEGDARQQIEHCHALARLLLSDVRDAVSTLRDEGVSFRDTLDLMVQNVPRLNIHLDVSEHINITDVNLAETLLRCIQEAITNTLRHTTATEMWVKLYHQDNHLTLHIRDDGTAPSRVQLGNGLTGMSERIERAGGEISIDTPDSLNINVRLPVAA